MYVLKVIKWGNSQALSLPKAIQDDLNLNVGDKLNVLLTENHELVIKKENLIKENVLLDK